MMLREGWSIETAAVTHRDRQGGTSKYGNLTRALVGIPDLLGAAWLIRRAAPPETATLLSETPFPTRGLAGPNRKGPNGTASTPLDWSSPPFRVRTD